MKKQTRLFSALMAFAIMATPPAILAQDDLLADAQTVLNQEQIDISGDFDAPEEKSPEEMVEEARQANEKKNVQRISKKVANLKVSKKQVKKITKKEGDNLSGRIANIFGMGDNQDSVSTSQSATTKKVVAQVEAPKQKDLGQEDFRIIPSAGFQTIQGQGINFESKYSTGLALETMVTSNIAIGFGVNYSALDIKDIKNNYNYYGYNNSFSVDELEYSHLALNANGKYFFSRGMFRPYIGLGLGFNRTSLKYSANNSNYNGYSYNGYAYNGYRNNNIDMTEEYSESYLSGMMSVGAEMKFAKNVGVVVEGSYSQGLTDGFNAQSVYNTEKQVRLDEIGGAISSSSFFALNAGLLVTF